jgi:hypothetical protein
MGKTRHWSSPAADPTESEMKISGDSPWLAELAGVEISSIAWTTGKFQDGFEPMTILGKRIPAKEG